MLLRTPNILVKNQNIEEKKFRSCTIQTQDKSLREFEDTEKDKNIKKYFTLFEKSNFV